MESSAAPFSQDSQPTTPIEPIAGGRSNPEELRASLEAVRAVQETARARARRETRRARLIVAGVMVAGGRVAWNLTSRRAPSLPAAIAAPAPAAVESAAAAPPAPVAGGPGAESAPAVPAAAPLPQPAVRVVAAAPTASAGAVGADDVAACDGAFADRRWPLVATACAAAYKVRPVDSALAMRVAQAQHRRGYVADAGEWAQKAIALDPNIAEAYPILGRAEAKAGDARAAATAYRRYLVLAPRGWHASEARRALARAEAP